MAAERRISILIDTAGDPSGLDLIENRFSDVETSADRLFGALQAGLAIDIGGRLVSGLSRVPEAFERAVQRGIEFNAMLEQQEQAFATLLGSAEAAGQRVDELYQFSAATPFQFGEVTQASKVLQSFAGNALATGEGLRLVGDAAAAVGRPIGEVSMWFGRLYASLANGVPAGEAIARLTELGLVSGDTRAKLSALSGQALSQAEVMRVLGDSFGFTSGAMEKQSRTLNGVLSTLSDKVDDVLGKITQPIFEGVKQGTLELSAALSDPQVVESLRALGFEIAKLVEAGYDLTQWAIENQGLLVFLARAATAYGVAMAAIKIGDLLQGLARKAVALAVGKAALDAETAALGRNTAAQAANTAARAGGIIPGYGQVGRASATAASAAQAAERAKRAKRANAGQFAGPIAPLAPRAAPVAAAGMGSAGVIAGVGTIATAALVTYVVGEMIARGMIARAEAQEANVAAAGEASWQQTTRLAGEGADIATLEERADLLKRIKEAREAASAAASATGDLEVARVYLQQLRTLDLLYLRTQSISAAELARREGARATAQYLADQASAMERLGPEVAAAAAALAEADFGALSPEEQLAKLRRRRGEVEGGLGENVAAFDATAGGDPAAAEAARLEVLRSRLQLVELDKVILALEAKITAQTEKTAAATKSQADARAEITSDILAAEARARGDTDAAERLERQKRLREEIRRIVEATGASEEEAERVARRLILAQEAAAKGAAGAQAGAGAGAAVPGLAGRDGPPRLGTESYDETNARMGRGLISAREPFAALPAVRPFSFVVPPAAPSAAPAGAGAGGGAGGGGRNASTDTLYQLTAELLGAGSAEREAEAAEALKAYGETVKALLAAGDRRYAELVAQLKIVESQIKTGRTR